MRGNAKRATVETMLALPSHEMEVASFQQCKDIPLGDVETVQYDVLAAMSLAAYTNENVK